MHYAQRWLVAGWVALSGILVAGPLARADVVIGAATVFAGPEAQIGEQVLRGAQMAVEDLNAAGGVLGQKLKLSVVDDACEGSQAVAAAQKLVSEGVVFVVGHICSAAAIPASEVYEKAGVLEISPAATNPKLTEQGRDNVFRVIGRDDQQGAVAADYIAHHWPNAKIAVVHDGTTYGEGLGTEMKRELNKAGVSEVLFESIVPGKADHPELMAKLQAAGVTVLFFGGYGVEAGILARNAHDMGLKIQFVGGDGLDTYEFIQVAGPAGEGAIFTAQADARRNPAAADVVRRFRDAGFEPEGATLYTYAAVQIWSQAVAKAQTFKLDKVVAAVRDAEFATVIGPIGFDAKGDLRRPTFAWYVWKGDGYVLIP